MRIPSRVKAFLLLVQNAGPRGLESSAVRFEEWFDSSCIACELSLAGENPDNPGHWVLSAAGHLVAMQEAARLEAARQARNASARGRSDAMRSVGMKKTRYGWE
jgi:hypothetical protein